MMNSLPEVHAQCLSINNKRKYIKVKHNSGFKRETHEANARKR